MKTFINFHHENFEVTPPSPNIQDQVVLGNLLLQGKPSSSSHSLSSSTTRPEPAGKSLTREENPLNLDTSTEDVFDLEARDTPPNSHVEAPEKSKNAMTLPSDSQGSEQTVTGSSHCKNKTYDVSSGGSSDANDFELGETINGEGENSGTGDKSMFCCSLYLQRKK